MILLRPLLWVTELIACVAIITFVLAEDKWYGIDQEDEDV